MNKLWNKILEMNAKPASVLLVAALFLGGLFLATAFAEEGTSPQKAQDSVVAIGNDKHGKFCSAVHLGEGRFVSAAHCDIADSYVVEEFRDAKGVLTKEVHYSIKTIKTNVSSDQYLFETLGPVSFGYAKVCQDDLKTTDSLEAIGFPGGEFKTRTYGEFVAMDYLSKRIEAKLSDPFYRTTVPLTGGNSGGGLFKVTLDGHCLTGIATAVRRDYPFISFFSTLDALKKTVGANG